MYKEQPMRLPTLDDLVRLYLLVKPKAHNKIAWAIVAVGAGVIAQPIWEPYVRAAASALIGKGIDPPSPNPWIGVLLVIVGAGYHFASSFIDKRPAAPNPDVLAHDRELARRIRETLPERKVESFLDSALGAHSVRDNQMDTIEAGQELMRSAEVHFLDSEVAAAWARLRSASDALLVFMAESFDTYPENPKNGIWRIALAPQMSLDRGHPDAEQIKKYDELTAQLNALGLEYREAYRLLIASFHERLQM